MKKVSALLLALFTLLLSSCMTMVFLPNLTREITIENNIKKILKGYPSVISITKIYGFGYKSEIFKDPFALDIKMENGKRLFIAFIRSSGLKPPFVIYLAGKSKFDVQVWGGTDKGWWVRSGIPVDFLSRNIKTELKSVEDLIKNYDLIINFTNSLTKLADINELLDIKDRYEIITNNGETHGKVGAGWRNYKYINPIKDDDNEWFILNITQDEFPEAFTFLDEKKWEQRYIHYRK